MKKKLGSGDFDINFFPWWLQLDTTKSRACLRTQEMTPPKTNELSPYFIWLLRERKESKKKKYGILGEWNAN